MHFTEPVYRNPYWPTWPLLEVTRGCTHNRCKFCTMYKSVPFGTTPMSQIEEDLAELAATVPQSYVTADRPTPPTLIMHGSRDMTVNFQQSVHLYEAMRKMGKEVECIKVLGANHGFDGFACDEALAEVDRFLKKRL